MAFLSFAELATLLLPFAYILTRIMEDYIWDPDQRDERIAYKLYENGLQQSMGIRCEVPELDPFSKEITKYGINISDIRCPGQDWVKCYHSKCRIVDSIKDHIGDIQCTFIDILYHYGSHYTMGTPTHVGGDVYYELNESDHAKVECLGTRIGGNYAQVMSWRGYAIGLRSVRPPPAPPGRERTPSILIFGFDAASRHAFIRRMPKSWQMLKHIGATVMEGYNVVGYNSRYALIPILSGRTDLELPFSGRLRKGARYPLHFDPDTFIFSKLKKDGYRTAYFEDRPDINTLHYGFYGFSPQPTDYYLRGLLMSYWFQTEPFYYWVPTLMHPTYCLGDTPQFKVMMNITQQFLELGGKGFVFTFINDITHDNFDMISNADDDTAAFLRGLLSRTEDTLIVVMGDHGPRFIDACNSAQGRLEHRLPLLAIRLPDRLTRARPHAQRALEANARALTTPHDLHATILDVLDMRQHWNPYTVKGASYPRALTMLELIPRTRSCGEAGIEPHWCACLTWQNVSADDPMYHKTARALMDYINSLLDPVRDLCVPRVLHSTLEVLRQDNGLQVGRGAIGANMNYRVEIVSEPGGAVFEATVPYLVKEDRFQIDATLIFRLNSYGSQPDCISKTRPDLKLYCYCRDTA